jgi:hypothetical protein
MYNKSVQVEYSLWGLKNYAFQEPIALEEILSGYIIVLYKCSCILRHVTHF